MKKSFFVKTLQGILVGMGSIAPGFSGSTLAVSMGIYDSIIGACNGLISDFKNIKTHLLYLLPFAIGGGVGILVLAQVINWMFAAIPVLATFIFIGLLLGSIPNVLDSANEKGFRKSYIVFAGLFFLLALALGFFADKIGVGIVQENPTFLRLFLYGAILGLGTIIPGLSSSFMLMSIGGYETTMSAISGLNLQRILPIGLGVLLVIAACIKVIDFMVQKFHGYLYYSMIGLVFGSIVTVLPSMTNPKELGISVLVCIGCTIVSYFSFKIRFKGYGADSTA